MENFNLTDEEARTFAEWFSNLDVDKQAKLSFKNVTNFMSAYQLNDDDLDKIFDICGAKRLDHFGRSQFYIALKLVALTQNGYELSLENLSKPNLPLPRRLQISNNSFDQHDKPLKTHLNSIDFDSYSSISSITNSTSSFLDNKLLPPPPVRSKPKIKSPSQICTFCNKPLITTSSTVDQEQAKHLKSFVLICPNCKHSNQNSPNEQPSTVNTQNISDLTSDSSRCSSTELYETIDTSLALNKLKDWEKLEQTTQDYVGGLDDTDESKHCLLNDEEEQVDSNKICLNINNYDQYDSSYFNPSSSSNTLEESDDDVWSMSDDQVKYYNEKFCQLLPTKQDISRLAGSSVKSFFEKSKLSLADLKKIWSLSDLDADGHLSLIEFCIAMHLIVLRRNTIDLPDQLPVSLSPLKINQLLVRNQLSEGDQSSNSSHSSSLQPNYHTSSSNVSMINVPTHSVPVHNVTTVINQPVIGSSNQHRNSFDLLSAKEHEITINSPNNREWTKFNNSPFANPNGRQRLLEENDCNHHHLNNQSNLQSIASDVNCLMTPANFTDKIELDPTLVHPLAVKGNSLNSQQFVVDSINLQSNKDSTSRTYKSPATTVLNPPIHLFPPRQRGHARSSSLDLTRSIIGSANQSTHHSQGAFVTYRKHIQQQHGHPAKSTFSNGGNSNKKDKQYFLQKLKAKYTLPDHHTSDSSSNTNYLKECVFHYERIRDELIDELANALEQLSAHQQRNS